MARRRMHVFQNLQLYAATCNKTSRSFQDLWSTVLFRNKLESEERHEMCVLNVSEMQWTKFTPSSPCESNSCVAAVCTSVRGCVSGDRGVVFF